MRSSIRRKAQTLPMGSSRDRLVVLALALWAAGAGCSTAAAVFLDIPKSTDIDEPPVAALAVTTVAAADTVRPAIESVVDPDSVLALLPRAPDGAIDWAAAVEDGVIAPSAGPDAESPTGAGAFAYDFYFGAFETFFPHSVHVAVLDCAGCHPAIFRQRGSSSTMSEIMQGASCGECHGKVAFTVNACERCHPSSNMPPGRLKAELKDDVVFPRDSSSERAAMMGNLAPGLFPHWTHRIRYRCDACHPAPFEIGSDTRVLTMADMEGGRTCGACHNGSVAFGLLECARCHRDPVSVPSRGD